MKFEGVYCAQQLNKTINDCDEDGRNADPAENWRLVRANGEAFQMTYHFRVGGPKASEQSARASRLLP